MTEHSSAIQSDWYAQVAAQLRHNHARLRNEVIPRLRHAFSAGEGNPFLAPMRFALGPTLEHVLDTLNHLGERIGHLLAAVDLPSRSWHASREWTTVRGLVSGVAGDLGNGNRRVHLYWRGYAAEAYESMVPAHAAAANGLATVAGATQFALSWAAMAAATFYAGLVTLVVQTIAAALTAAAAAVSVAAGPAALVALLMALAAITAQLGALILAVTEAYGRLRVWMNQARSELNNNSAFPHGSWPVPVTSAFRNDYPTDEDWYPVA